MYYIGLFFYVITFLSCFLFQGIKEMVQQCILLAPEISYAMIGIYIYPLIIFVCHKLLKKNTHRHYIFLASQTKLSASVTVSLGLIGTFIGLTGMITAISASLAGDGDVAEKMTAMISSISMALNSMSFAFLTSILGVSISVLLLVSLNFFYFFYQKEAKEKDTIKKQDVMGYANELNQIKETLCTLQDVNINIAKKLVSIPENSQLASNIDNSLSSLSAVAQQQLNVLNALKDDLLEEQKNRTHENEQLAAGILEISHTTQWLQAKSLENRKKLLTLLSME